MYVQNKWLNIIEAVSTDPRDILMLQVIIIVIGGVEVDGGLYAVVGTDVQEQGMSNLRNYVYYIIYRKGKYDS